MSSLPMFGKIADRLFKEAGVDKTLNIALWDQATTILNDKMAMISHLGLVGDAGRERIRLFDEQKQSLIEDLKQMKKSGKIAGVQ